MAVRDVEPDVGQDVWIHDIARSLTTRLTLSPSDDSRPFWSPAGKQVVFWSDRNGNADVFIKPADGGGEAKAVLAAPSTEYPTDWSPDGKVILVERISRQTSIDLWYVKLEENSEAPKAVPYLQTAANERVGQFSPQARYVVYVSDESGQEEVYVRPFPEGGGKWQVSVNGGAQPRWSRENEEIFYVEGGALMAVPVTASPAFSAGPPSRLSSDPALDWHLPSPTYDVAADGRRFVLVETLGEAPVPSIHVVENWSKSSATASVN